MRGSQVKSNKNGIMNRRIISHYHTFLNARWHLLLSEYNVTQFKLAELDSAFCCFDKRVDYDVSLQEVLIKSLTNRIEGLKVREENQIPTTVLLYQLIQTKMDDGSLSSF